MDVNKIYEGSCVEVLKSFPDNSIDCCVTSPPYYGLRDYGMPGQMGMEETPDEYIFKMVQLFSQVNRVLKPEGTLWLNIGDSYAATSKNRTTEQANANSTINGTQSPILKQINKIVDGLKPKDLIGIPWMLAFALRAAGWYLRMDIIWHKKNCMPESVTDRPTKSHEYIFLLSKSSKYYYDSEAIKEDCIYDLDGTGTASRKARAREDLKSHPNGLNAGIRPGGKNEQLGKRTYDGFNQRWDESGGVAKRNKRSVWVVAPAQFPEAHFATFPEDLIIDCIKAGCPDHGLVLDPFMGAGTTALVSRKAGRNFVGIELNPDYIKIAEDRLKKELGMFL